MTDNIALVDSHCHLNMLESEGKDLDVVMQNARAAGVKHFLCVSVEIATFPAVLQCAERYSDVSASVGQHPNDVIHYHPSVEELVGLAQQDLVIAIGETGLDYYRTTPENVAQQQQAFREHIAAAKQVKKPLIIHSRHARADTIQILAEENAQDVCGVMHCFTEDWAMAKQALDLGFYISLSGIVTFKNAVELQSVAKQVPSDRLLVETDCPYLAPVPMRGKPNEPAYVRYTAEFLAELRNTDLATLAAQTTANFYQLFSTARR